MQSTKAVTKPSKQRWMLHQAPNHVRHRLFAAHVSPELRASHLVKTFPVRSGDTVRVIRGDHKGFEGKVTRIDNGTYRIYVEGLTREKVDGTTIFVPIHPSKVMITNLNLDDKWRKKILEGKRSLQAKPKVTQGKPREKQRAKRGESARTIETKPPVAEKKVTEEPRTEEEKRLPEKALTEEKPRKKIAKPKKRTSRKVSTPKTEIESKELERERKPATEKKKPKNKATKKTEGGQ